MEQFPRYCWPRALSAVPRGGTSPCSLRPRCDGGRELRHLCSRPRGAPCADLEDCRFGPCRDGTWRRAWHASPGTPRHTRRAGGRGSAVEGGDEAVEVVV